MPLWQNGATRGGNLSLFPIISLPCSLLMPGTTRKGSWLYRVVPYQPHAVPRACLPGSTEPNHDHRVRRVRRVRPARPGAAVS